MTALHDIQFAFMRDIYSGEKNSHQYLSDDKDFAQRLSIYSNNALLGLTDTLENIYPVIKKIVGDKFFTMMSRDFIKTHHQNSGNRNKFGRELSVFLENYAPSVSLLYLPDIAALEWSYFQSAIAEDAQALSFESLSQNIASNPDYILSVHDSVHILEQKYNALEIWQAHQHDPIEALELKSDVHTLLVWRDTENTILMRKISPALKALIKQCQENKTFAEAITIAGQHTENIETFQQEFAEAVNHNIFVQTEKETHHD
jgi:hypothetical protein